MKTFRQWLVEAEEPGEPMNPAQVKLSTQKVRRDVADAAKNAIEKGQDPVGALQQVRDKLYRRATQQKAAGSKPGTTGPTTAQAVVDGAGIKEIEDNLKKSNNPTQ